MKVLYVGFVLPGMEARKELDDCETQHPVSIESISKEQGRIIRIFEGLDMELLRQG